MINIYLALIMILVGFYGLMVSKTIIKSLLSLNIVQAAVIVLFLDLVALESTEVPIYLSGIRNMVDPLPQALMLTTIVIGASITALILMMSIKIFHYFGTLDWSDVLERKL